MNGLAPYIAAGFVAALTVTSLDFGLAGASAVTTVSGSLVDLPHSSASGSGKGDLLRPAGGPTLTVSTVELVGLRDATIVMLRDAAGQARSDPTSGVIQELID